MKHPHSSLIDLLTTLAQKTTGDIYVTLTGKSWNISTAPDRHNAKVDRANLQGSITAHVDRVMPAPDPIYG